MEGVAVWTGCVDAGCTNGAHGGAKSELGHLPMHCLHDHCINLVRAEFELVAGKRMSQSDGHGTHLRGGGASDEIVDLIAQPTHELCHTVIPNALDAKLLFDYVAQLGIRNGERVLPRSSWG